MTEISHSAHSDVLSFWFGVLDENGRADASHQKKWWSKDPAFDTEVRERFAAAYAELVSPLHPPAPWTNPALGLLSCVIVLDQLPRNMFRGSAAMFATDELARRNVYELLALGLDRQLPTSYRTFAYMPLMHSERSVDQDRCVELFQMFTDESSDEERTSRLGFVKYATLHQEIVARFGRFPHRNGVLGRANTDEETAFLKEPGSSF